MGNLGPQRGHADTWPTLHEARTIHGAKEQARKNKAAGTYFVELQRLRMLAEEKSIVACLQRIKAGIRKGELSASCLLLHQSLPSASHRVKQQVEAAGFVPTNYARDPLAQESYFTWTIPD